MKTGEHFILGFKGPTLPSWVREFEKEFGLGGVILFDYDFATKKYENNVFSHEQVTELCREIKALKSHPLITIDQEGGKVRRLKEGKGFQPLASAKQADSLSDAEYLSQLTASFSEMRALGVDVDLMPVVDLDTNPMNPDIGKVERSYSSEPSRVARAVELCRQAAEKTGMKLCLKHYPGLGGATVNSHEELTDISGTFSEEQLGLFHDFVEKIPGESILVSHGIVKEWDPEWPLSMSERGLAPLRKAHPLAVLISDDLQMQGLQRKLSTQEAVLRGVSIGMDLLCVGNNLIDEQAKMGDAAEQLRRQAEKSPSLRSNLESSSRRIARWKMAQ